MIRRALNTTAVLAAVLALGACGQSDEDQVRQVVRDFATALSESDGEKLCDELVTQEFLEQLTLAQGDGAQGQCRNQVDALKGSAFAVSRIQKTTIDGDEATVNAEIRQGGQTRPQIFKLKKEDGEFRLSSQG